MANNYDNDEYAPQPKPFPAEMVADIESSTVAHEIRDYLWGKGPIDYENVSAHMKRPLVLKFVEFELPDLPPQYFWRVRIIADLYNLVEILGYMQTVLTRQESEPVELDRSIAGTIMMEEIGDERQKRGAARYYEYLVSHQFADQKFAELIQCRAVFGNRVSSDSLRARMEAEIKSLAAREASEPEAGTEKRYVEDLADNEFFFIDEANKSRERIDAIDAPNQRLLELIKAYLYLTDDDGGEYFQLWTHQQIRRAAEATSSGRIIEAFRFMLANLDKLDKADKNFCKVRSLNAIEFFEGKLNEDEAAFMNKNRNKQIDPLHYIEVPLHYEEPEEEEEDFDEDEDENKDENAA